MDEYKLDFQLQNERDLREKDPLAYQKLVNGSMIKSHLIDRYMVVFAFTYIIFLTYIFIENFPSVDELDEMVKNDLFLDLFPFLALAVAGILFALKLLSPTIYGATEVSFGFGSAYSAVGELANEGLAVWAVAIGVVYLFVQGFENLFKGLKRDTNKARSQDEM